MWDLSYFFTPPKAPAVRRGRPSVTPQTTNTTTAYYDAAQSSKDRQTPKVSLDWYTHPKGRQKLAYLGRWIFDNNGQVALAVDTVCNFSGPVHPQAGSPNNAANQILENYFAEWSKRCDVTGRFSLDGLQRKVMECGLVEGDAGFVISKEEGEQPKLQLVEGARIGRPSSDNQIYTDELDGVGFDSVGRPTYYVIQQTNRDCVTVDASQFYLFHDPPRYSHYRGCSPLRRGMHDIRDRQEIKGYEKKATKISSALAGWLSGGADDAGTWAGNDTTNADQTNPGITEAQLLGGDFPVLPAGQELHLLENKRPGDKVIEFLDALSGDFVSGLGIPPAFFLDSKLTGPNQRSVNAKAQRKFEQLQGMLCDFVEWVWVRVIADGIASGAIPAVPGWEKVHFQSPRKLTIDAGREAAADRDDFKNGLTTRQALFGAAGKDWIREVEQGFAEDEFVIQRAKLLAEKYDVPCEMILARYGFDPSVVKPEKPDTEDMTIPDKQPSGKPEVEEDENE